MSLPVCVTFANYGYRNFAINLMRNFQDVIKHHKLVFYCVDREIYELLKPFQSERIELALLENVNVAHDFFEFGDKKFVQLMHHKLRVILHALSQYSFVHFLDCDVVFCKEPTADYYVPYKHYDIVFQGDTAGYPLNIYPCMGNVTLRNTPGTHALFKQIVEYTHKNPERDDQGCLNLYLYVSGFKSLCDTPFAKLYEYPHNEYVCGAYIRDDTFQDRSTFVTVHANHVVGYENKVKLLQKIGKWYIPDSTPAPAPAPRQEKKKAILPWLRTHH